MRGALLLLHAFECVLFVGSDVGDSAVDNGGGEPKREIVGQVWQPSLLGTPVDLRNCRHPMAIVVEEERIEGQPRERRLSCLSPGGGPNQTRCSDEGHQAPRG